jgi:hypothetical protein
MLYAITMLLLKSNTLYYTKVTFKKRNYAILKSLYKKTHFILNQIFFWKEKIMLHVIQK